MSNCILCDNLVDPEKSELDYVCKKCCDEVNTIYKAMGIGGERMIKEDCQHRWHFVEMQTLCEETDGTTDLTSCYEVAKFICERCGKIKQVKEVR